VDGIWEWNTGGGLICPTKLAPAAVTRRVEQSTGHQKFVSKGHFKLEWVLGGVSKKVLGNGKIQKLTRLG